MRTVPYCNEEAVTKENEPRERCVRTIGAKPSGSAPAAEITEHAFGSFASQSLHFIVLISVTAARFRKVRKPAGPCATRQVSGTILPSGLETAACGESMQGPYS